MNITQSFVSERDRALLGGDYDSYHSRAVRRLHALRKRLGVATPKGRKYTPKSPVTAENVAQSPEWVELLLASSERAWAHAMVMKSSQSPENTQKPMASSTKKQIISRYKRAIMHATNLVQIVEDQATSKATTVDFLEAKAYLGLLKGGLAFEKAQWNACIHDYAVARIIYSALAVGAKTDMYKDLLSSTVDPSIRYAAYQLKLPRTKLVSDLAIESFPNSESELRAHIEKIHAESFTTSSNKAVAQSNQPSRLPSTVTWRARKVNIEDATVSQALGIALDKETAFETTLEHFRDGKLSSKELAMSFDEVINARQDVVDATKNAIDELRGEGVDQGDTRIQSLQVARTAINYAVIEWRVGRNRILCGADDGLVFASQSSKPNTKPRKDGKPRVMKEESSGKQLSRLRERIVLYDSTLQSIDAVKELPGVIADTGFVQELDGKRAYFQALKCLAIGHSHALNGAVLNALALYSRSHDLAQVVLDRVKPPEDASEIPHKIYISATQLHNLRDLTNGLTLKFQALADISGVSKTEKPQKAAFSPSFIEKLQNNQFEDNLDLTNLVNYPPKLQPVPVKPLFFDLAWNYIRYPGKDVDVDSVTRSTNSPAVSTESAPPPAKKGWFGFGR